MSKLAELYQRESLVKVKNIDTEDFNFRVAGKDYIVKAGSTASMPGYMANHFVSKLTDKIMIDGKKEAQMNNELIRSNYYSKIDQGILNDSIKPVNETIVEASQRTSIELGEEGVKGELPEEDFSEDKQLTNEEAEKVLPKDEDLYPAPKKEEEKVEEEFPDLEKVEEITSEESKKA